MKLIYKYRKFIIGMVMASSLQAVDPDFFSNHEDINTSLTSIQTQAKEIATQNLELSRMFNEIAEKKKGGHRKEVQEKITAMVDFLKSHGRSEKYTLKDEWAKLDPQILSTLGSGCLEDFKCYMGIAKKVKPALEENPSSIIGLYGLYALLHKEHKMNEQNNRKSLKNKHDQSHHGKRSLVFGFLGEDQGILSGFIRELSIAFDPSTQEAFDLFLPQPRNIDVYLEKSRTEINKLSDDFMGLSQQYLKTVGNQIEESMANYIEIFHYIRLQTQDIYQMINYSVGEASQAGSKKYDAGVTPIEIIHTNKQLFYALLLPSF